MQVLEKIQKGTLGVGIVSACALAWSLVIGLMFLTSPEQVGPAGVTLWFLLLFVALLTAAMLLSLANARRKGKAMGVEQFVAAFRISVAPAAALCLTLALSSLGSLSLTDIVLIAAVTGVISMYFLTTNRRAG